MSISIYDIILQKNERNSIMYEDIFDQEVQKKMDDFFLKNLASHGKLISFKKGEIIKQEDFESIYILLEGELNQIMHSKEGDEIIFFRVVEGNIFGEMAFFDKTSTFALNKAVTKGSVSVVNRKFVESKLKEDPQIYHYFIALGGTTFGLAEETIALYPILVPVFMIAGYDAIVCIAALYMGSSIGTMFSTVNPFSSVIASNAAGIAFTNGLAFRLVGLIIATIITVAYIIRYAEKIKKNPETSLIFSQKAEIEKRFLHVNKEVPEFTFRRKTMLALFVGAFGIMIWGVSSQDWWFMEMTALFLVVGILIGIISGLGEKDAVNHFVAGAADLVGVALTIGVARAVNLIMDNGLISDSILHSTTQIVDGMNGGIFAIIMLLVFSVLGFFIPSSSGLAVLSMPIMAPLADTVGIPREVVVSAYQYGQGLMAFITPTGLILVTLSMVDVTYDKWLKFIMPLMGIIGVFAAIMLTIQALV